MLGRLGNALVLGALVVIGAVVPANVAPAKAVDAHGADDFVRIEMDRYGLFFSPDGDGDHDRAVIRFSTDQRATLALRIKDRHGKVRGPISLGTSRAGRHVWRWDGRDNAGKRVADGAYAVLVRTVAGGASGSAYMTLQVRTRPDAGALVAGRSTVYPKARIVDDRVQLVYQRQGYDEFDADYPEDAGGLLKLRAVLVVRDSAGHAVFRAASKRYVPRFEWGGTDDGKVLPAGKYRGRVRVTDGIGNVRVLRKTLRVSHKQLVEEVWTRSVAAAQASGYAGPTYDPGCLGCGEYCAPEPSTRYPGGLSFPACDLQGSGAPTAKFFTADLPFREAPVDTYRLSSTGGPTTPGASDRGRLSAGLAEGVDTLQGDGTATTGWAVVDLTRYPYLPGGLRPVQWAFSTLYPQSYDVASFTIEYRHYVPAG